MRIKRFKAQDTKTALMMVKEELGEEAVILSTREIKDDGRWPTTVEITAGVNFPPPAKDPDPPQPANPKPFVNSSAGYPPPQVIRPEKKRTEETLPSRQTIDLRGLEGGLEEIKELLLDLTLRTDLSAKLRHRKDLLRLYRDLVDAEIDPSIARALLEKISRLPHNEDRSLREALHHRIAALIRTDRPFAELPENRTGYVALVGPSGVGKTTTLAKLAADSSRRKKKKVALISLDTFRLGASEQLKTYARIMGLPVRIVRDKDEFHQAVELFEGMDLVLIDTSGRAINQEDSQKEMAACLDLLNRPAVLLVLSAATKDRDMAALIARSEPLKVRSLVVTKIDETMRYGNVVNNLVKSKKPVCYLTNGQKVPDDIMEARADHLAELITGPEAENRL